MFCRLLVEGISLPWSLLLCQLGSICLIVLLVLLLFLIVLLLKYLSVSPPPNVLYPHLLNSVLLIGVCLSTCLTLIKLNLASASRTLDVLLEPSPETVEVEDVPAVEFLCLLDLFQANDAGVVHALEILTGHICKTF